MNQTIGDLIRRNAALRGNATALVFEGRRYTHTQFAERIYRLANGLIDRGVKRHERIAILARNCSEYLESFGAAEVAGFISLGLNSRLSASELIDILHDCQPTVLIFGREFADVAAKIKAANDSVTVAICIEGATGFAEGYDDVLAGASDQEPEQRPRPDDTAYLIYTSGSTGRPKGVMYDHAGMIEAAVNQCLDCGRRSDDVMLIVMPLFHVGGKIMQMMCLVTGAAIVLHRQFDEIAVLADIQTEKVSCALFAPVMIQRLLEAPQLAAADISTLKGVVYSSAPMPVPLLKRALERFGPIFTQIYGMTECLGGSVLKPDQHRLSGNAEEVKRLGSAGQALYGSDIRVVRPDRTDCAPGEIGEVLIASGGMMQGYWNNTAATYEALRDGWYHTGDLGLLDEERYLFIMDRKKDMIISGGENIYSWEVEEALRTHASVAEVAVIAVPDPKWGEAVKACVVLQADTNTDADDLIAHCRERIASYKRPRSIDFIDALPRLFNGKIDKKALRARYWTGSDRFVS